jgi:hypothetical protein
MPQEPATFDDILDQLAHGETFAARDDMAFELRDDLTDGGPDGSRSGRRAVASPRQTPRREVYAGEPERARAQGRMLLVPRPTAIVRVFSLAVVVMMALMTALAAIIAQAVQDLTGQVRNDERFNVAANVGDQPVDPAVLMNEASFSALLLRWPDRRQQLLFKRFRAFSEDGDWRAAIAAFAEAEAEDLLVVPAADRLRHLNALIACRELERAQAELPRIPVAELDEAQRQQLNGITARLQLALLQPPGVPRARASTRSGPTEESRASGVDR